MLKWLFIGLSIQITYAQSNLPIQNVDALSDTNKLLLARIIYTNETNCNPDYLIHWNPFENFLSLGILHSVATHKYFKTNSDSFPTYWAFLMEQHKNDPTVEIPKWIADRPPTAPGWIPEEWITVKGEPKEPIKMDDGSESCFPQAVKGQTLNYADRFNRVAGKIKDPTIPVDPRIAELRSFLSHPKVVTWQAKFALMRVKQGLEKIETTMAASPELPRVRENIRALLDSPAGIFAMTDYTNWKGEGVGGPLTVRSFGLRMVLRNMRLPTDFATLNGTAKAAAATKAFGDAVMLTFRDFTERRYAEADDHSTCGMQRAREAYNRWMGWLAKGNQDYPCYPDLRVDKRASCVQKQDGGFLTRVNRTYVSPDFDKISTNCSKLGGGPPQAPPSATDAAR